MNNIKRLETEVCIIGAGISGLNAACTLLESPESPFSSDDIVILEAQDRIGGRLFTDRSSSKLGLSYDLGASWYHDSLNNVVLNDLLKEHVIEFSRDCFYDDKERVVYAEETTGPIDSRDLKLRQVVKDIEKYIEIYYFENLEVNDVPLYEIVARFIEEKNQFLTDDQKLFCGRMLRYLECWYGITWDKISARYSIMDHQGRDVFNKSGYDVLLKRMLKTIPMERIYLKHPVKSIDRTNSKYIRSVAVQAGDLLVYCKYVIVTVPLSILSLTAESPFAIEWRPPLSPNISNSFSKMHFGALGKVIFEFDDIWWDENEERFEIMASEAKNRDLSQTLTQTPKPFTYPTFVLNYAAIQTPLSGSGGSLLILTPSPLTEYLENHPEEAWNYYKPMLAKLVKEKHSMSDPINVITSGWTKNPYIRGSYSSLEVGDDPTDLIVQLSNEFPGSLDNRVRFAGEHTILDGCGCVHGAYLSGSREAKWIINHVKSS